MTSEGKEENAMNKEMDFSFMYDDEPSELKVIKRRVPLKHNYLKGDEARRYVVEINQSSQYHQQKQYYFHPGNLLKFH